MALPGRYNISIWQGDHFERDFLVEEDIGGTLVPVDFTDHEVIGQVRSHSTSPFPEAVFSIEWVNRSAGEFKASLVSNASRRLPKSCVYDIQSMDGDGKVRTWVYGNFRVIRDVSRG